MGTAPGQDGTLRTQAQEGEDPGLPAPWEWWAACFLQKNLHRRRRWNPDTLPPSAGPSQWGFQGGRSPFLHGTEVGLTEGQGSGFRGSPHNSSARRGQEGGLASAHKRRTPSSQISHSSPPASGPRRWGAGTTPLFPSCLPPTPSRGCSGPCPRKQKRPHACPCSISLPSPHFIDAVTEASRVSWLVQGHVAGWH